MWNWFYIYHNLRYNNDQIWNWVTSLLKKVDFNLLDDEYFTIPYITDTIPNSSASHELQEQAKRYVCIIDMNGEETITAQGTLY